MHRAFVTASALLTLAAPAQARTRVAHSGDWAPTTDKDVARFCRKHDSITGKLIIGSDWPLADLAPLRCIQSIGEGLVVRQAPLLERLDGLDGLKGNRGVALRVVRIVENPQLRSLDGLRSAQLATQSLVVTGNAALDHVDDSVKLVSGGKVLITANRKLQRVQGPPGTKKGVRVAQLTVSNNVALTQLGGFDEVDQVGELHISVNASLERLDGLPDLATVEDWIVRGNPSLSSWTAGTQLNAADSLIIEDNDALLRLPELPALQRATTVVIADNDALTDLSGIGGIGGHGGARAVRPSVDELRIEANDRLEYSAARALAARLALSDRPDALKIRANGGALPPSDASD